MSRFVCTDLPLEGLKLVERKRLGDSRGFLSRMFCADELAQCGWNKPVRQINHTYTGTRGTVRGLHFQYPPHGELKLVSVVHGEIWDVVVDLRSSSVTFLQWHAEILSAANGRAMLIPEGFAHGFQALSDAVDMLYCHSADYNPASEGGLNPTDPGLAINWPLDISEISHRDQAHPDIGSNYAGLSIR